MSERCWGCGAFAKVEADRDSWRILADSSRERAERGEAENERLREGLENAEVTFAKIGMPVYADACREALNA